MMISFRWTTYDVSGQLRATWRQDMTQVAATADFRAFPCTPVLSREATQVDHVPRRDMSTPTGSSAGCPGCTSSTAGRFLQLARPGLAGTR